jgi:hypothetical protein
MTGGTLLGRLRTGQRKSAAGRRPQTARELLTRVGRLLLWLAVGVVLLRGVAGTFTTAQPARVPHVSSRAAAAVWPDDPAKAFAVEFATAYLTHSPTDDPGAYTTALEAFASPELVAQLAPRFDEQEPREAVRSAAVAGLIRLDGRHALVTVAAALSGPPMLQRLVTVPIARDDRGGLVVYDLPSFASAPPRAAVTAPDLEPLFSNERAAIVDVLEPFLRAYLAGDTAALAYLVPPGARIAAAAGRWELIELTSVSAAGPATRAGRVVLATVEARDSASRATYALRYRVRLVRRDRWYVADLNGPGRGTR